MAQANTPDEDRSDVRELDRCIREIHKFVDQLGDELVDLDPTVAVQKVRTLKELALAKRRALCAVVDRDLDLEERAARRAARLPEAAA